MELSAGDVNEHEFAAACNSNAKRSGSLRYKDSPELLEFVKAQRQLAGREARDAAVRILAARKKAKTVWPQASSTKPHQVISELREISCSGQEVMARYLARTGLVPGPELFREDEIEKVVYGMKTAKSAGPDGVVYEHLQVMMSSELKPHFVEFMNRILVGELPLPEPWFTSKVAFLRCNLDTQGS